METKRTESIDLFKIIAMCMVIIVHYFATCNAGDVTHNGEFSYFVYIIIESLCICGVNMFVLITGYFSTGVETMKIWKIIDLVITVAFWGAIGFVCNILFCNNALNLKELIREMFPLLFGRRWFVKSYIVLCLFIPFINKIVNNITKDSYRILLMIFLFLFCLWPSFLPNPPIDDYGYGWVHFVFLYLIGGYIRKYKTKIPKASVCVIGYILSGILVIVSAFLNWGYAWAYNYIFVVLESIFLFGLFIPRKISNKAIVKLASCSFGVFLIHTNPFFSNMVYNKLFLASELICKNSIWLLISTLICAPTFYALGYFLEMGRKIIFSVTIGRFIGNRKLKDISIQ